MRRKDPVKTGIEASKYSISVGNKTAQPALWQARTTLSGDYRGADGEYEGAQSTRLEPDFRIKK